MLEASIFPRPHIVYFAKSTNIHYICRKNKKEAIMARRYPIDSADFEEIIQSGKVYVDKTHRMYEMTRDKYVFLTRPRRFGKSLLTNTLESYFNAQKELFEGLAIYDLEKDWIKHPTFRFDLSIYKDVSLENLRLGIDDDLSNLEKLFGYDKSGGPISNRFKNLIETAYKTTGQKTVIIIDEYDAPLLNHIHDGHLDEYRSVLQEFYQPLKACEKSLRFVFITGITNFSQVSIFSTINNLNKISMTDQYSDICGISKEELLTQFTGEIQELADKYQCSYDDMVGKLKYMYDGYRFSENSKEMFNPLSLMYVFRYKKIDNYWFQTATPTFIINHLKHFQVDPRALFDAEMQSSQFDVSAEDVKSVWPLMYQSGYATIKSYDPDFETFTLGLPNKEVECGLMQNIAISYLNLPSDLTFSTKLNFYRNLVWGKIDGAMEVLSNFFTEIPYDLQNKAEAHFETIMFVIFKWLGLNTYVEVKNAIGRLDVILFTKNIIYIIELKVDGSSTEALDQIDRMKYAVPYQNDGREIVKLGINISSEKRTIDSWEVRR